MFILFHVAKSFYGFILSKLQSLFCFFSIIKMLL